MAKIRKLLDSSFSDRQLDCTSLSFGSATLGSSVSVLDRKGVSLKLSMVAELRLSFASVSFASFACKQQRREHLGP